MSLLKKYFWILIVILIFTLDQVSKHLVINNLVLEEPVNLLPFLNLFFTFNPGAAFSFLNKAGGWQEWLFGGVAVVVGVFLVIWLYRMKEQDKWLKVSLALILGGTLGNLYDRIVYHQVVDFIDLFFKDWHYPVFNIADAAISIGAVMLIIDVFRKKDSKIQ